MKQETSLRESLTRLSGSVPTSNVDASGGRRSLSENVNANPRTSAIMCDKPKTEEELTAEPPADVLKGGSSKLPSRQRTATGHTTKTQKRTWRASKSKSGVRRRRTSYTQSKYSKPIKTATVPKVTPTAAPEPAQKPPTFRPITTLRPSINRKSTDHLRPPITPSRRTKAPTGPEPLPEQLKRSKGLFTAEGYSEDGRDFLYDKTLPKNLDQLIKDLPRPSSRFPPPRWMALAEATYKALRCRRGYTAYAYDMMEFLCSAHQSYGMPTVELDELLDCSSDFSMEDDFLPYNPRNFFADDLFRF